MPDADSMGKQAPAASDKVESVKEKAKEKVKEATDKVKEAVEPEETHDEL